ncbi:15860_t:CDS:2 [Acaulospora morrowiae]|uniref:15860_t:CDS:1 n=1 Tax=Acaulospora morrowiae TaxID=94023 RepID=A0A9N8ZI08_9GLOM|nr:15860_t:CDS:2 [Acaulospora morrowiae]
MTSNGSYNRNDVYQGSYGRSNYSYGETNPIPMHTNQAPPPYSEFFQEPPLQYSPHNYPYIQQALPPTQMANYNFLHVPPAHPNFQNFHQTFNVTPTQHYYSQNNQPHYIQQRHYTQQPQYLRQSFVRQPFTRQHFNPYASPSREYNNRFQGRGRGNFRNNRHVQSRRGRTIDLHSVSGGRGNFNRFGRRSRQQRQPIRSRMNKPDIYITNAENVSEKIDLSSIDFFSTEGKENKYQYHRSDTIIFYPVHAVSIRENRSEGRICVKKKQTGSSEPPRRMCENCERIETGRKWCSCYKAIFERNFINWSSGYENIDHFLRKAQQEANSVCELLEWIPYNRLRNILFVKKGGFGAVYSGIWCDGRIQRWDGNSGDWQRYGEEKVALKSLKISEDISNKFLSELEKYYICTKKVSHVLRSFGITKNPKNNELYMVMEWAENGNLQEYLQKNGRMNGRRMTWINKLNLLDSIANGLETIHREKLTHGDLHSGNILINREGIGWSTRDDRISLNNREGCDLALTSPSCNPGVVFFER